MKLLLIQPPIQDFYDTPIRLQPIGLAYLKAAVRKHLPQVEVKVYDFHAGWGRRTVPLPKELAYLRPYYPLADRSPFSTFDQYYHFGASFEEISRVVAAEAPDLVGISSLFTPYYREALAVATLVKQHSRARVLLGGSHVSADPRSVLEHPDVDLVIQGEGEKPLVELLARLKDAAPAGREAPPESDIAGLGYKCGGRLFLNPVGENFPLAELAPPDLSDFSPGRYRFRGKPLAFLVTSRSCPHRCSFCSVHSTFGTSYRRLPVDQVLSEMELRYAEGYRVFDFEDDNLTYYRSDMKELCREIARVFQGREVELLAMNGISYLSLDPELLGLMKRAGFTHLNLALVSSDRSVLESTKRPHTVAKYLEVVSEAQRLGFRVTSYQILGLPFESLDSMVQTLCFAARQPVFLGASPFYLTPGSPIARQLGVKLAPEDYVKSRLTAFAIETNGFSREDLYTLLVTTRVINFLKSFALRDEETELGSLPGDAERKRIGLELLRRLLSTGVLYAHTDSGLRPLPRFKTSVFFEVWEQLRFVLTTQGGRIRIQPPSRGKPTSDSVTRAKSISPPL